MSATWNKYVTPAMEGNWFYRHRREIADLARRDRVTVDIASRIFAQLNGMGLTVSSNAASLTDWDNLCIKYMEDDELFLTDLLYSGEGRNASD